ncbi:hypothetical protein D3C77_118670 [compost metagenome]
MPSTCKLDRPRLTSTRSMTLSNSIGVTNANSCNINEMISTLRNCRMCLRIEGRNQARPNARGGSPAWCSANSSAGPRQIAASSSLNISRQSPSNGQYTLTRLCSTASSTTQPCSVSSNAGNGKCSNRCIELFTARARSPIQPAQRHRSRPSAIPSTRPRR